MVTVLSTLYSEGKSPMKVSWMIGGIQFGLIVPGFEYLFAVCPAFVTISPGEFDWFIVQNTMIPICVFPISVFIIILLSKSLRSSKWRGKFVSLDYFVGLPASIAIQKYNCHNPDELSKWLTFYLSIYSSNALNNHFGE